MSSNALAMVPIRDPNHPKFGNRPSYAFLDAPSIEPHPLPAAFVWPPPPEIVTSALLTAARRPIRTSSTSSSRGANATPDRWDPRGMDESLDSELFVLVSIPPFPISFFCCDLFPWTVLCLSLRVPDPTPPLAPSSSITRPLYFQPVLSTGCSVLPSFCVPILPRGCKLPSTSPHPVLSTSSTQPLYMVIGPELPIAWRLISGIPPLGIASSPDRVTTLDGSAVAVATQIVSSLNTFTSLPIMTPWCGHPWRLCALS